MKYVLLILLSFHQLITFSQSDSEKMDVILVPKDAEYSCGEITKWNSGDKYFLVDQFSDSSFKVVDGTVVEDGEGNKVQKSFNDLSFGSSFTFE